MSSREMEQEAAEDEVLRGAADKAAADNSPEENTTAGEDAGEGTGMPVSDDESLEALQAENAELRDKILRMAAENQNTRRRLEKSKQDALKYRHQDILRDLAEVMDNFERAIESSVESRDFDTFHEGIKMIEKQFSGMLTERYNLERVGVDGEPFDPAAHEAMMMEESADVEVETVKQVFQAGYRLHDRVLRPAKVVVQKPAPAAAAADEQDGEDAAEDLRK